ncbi:uncharacterized protein MYCGRDRAFT_70391 [Zymoseptoria tritici IPO323]|uniref:SH3 domain-containing protein n=1 Tax=Zymoseptoria tritici (strain CBS 115943 / IPO323) TaxID=336722 RepID=F9X6G5_ZYMTI|nr:uncharacterized protein MYCGRDRAFT_70391 [Zymoseptoria tritici IPO323]EGP89203.1 hypothetical protein MYCGRDRAFT_70391 [Zymoseptoria tritici IPO323]
MNSIKRMGGKMMKRSDDQQDVGAVISEFKSTENMLDRLARDLKTWRESWEDILKYQSDAAEAFVTLYKPIPIPADVDLPQHYTPVETPQSTLQRTVGLHKAHADSKTDLQQEIAQIQSKLIRPVEEAKIALRGLQRTLKHRENMKLDYERYLSRAEHARKKEAKTVKDQTNLAKCEGDLVQAKIDYQTADEQVKQTFPPVTDAVLALMPYLLAGQVMLQTTLVGQLYTVLDAYCKREGLPSPAPSDAEIISRWDAEYTGFRKEVESGLKVLAGGKAVHMSMTLPVQDSSTVTGLGIRNKARSGVSGLPGLNKTKSEQPLAHLYGNPPPYSTTAGGASSPSIYHTPVAGLSPPASHTSRNDYFDRKVSQSSLTRTTSNQAQATTPNGTVWGVAAAAAAAAKKKPPPPIPAKRLASTGATFVTALYDFAGQSDGDLAFREGDRIRVVRRTESTDDWWEGECEGRKGQFPANYVQM